MPNIVKTGVPSYARLLPALLWGQGDGEVVRLSCVMWLSLLKGSWPAFVLALGLVLLNQLGLGRSGLCS
jgi:hypothetical protein